MTLPATITLLYTSPSQSNATELEFSPSPHSFPDNISGRTCTMTCNVFSLDPSVAPASSSTTDTYILICTLPQPFSRVMTESVSAIGRTAIGAMFGGQSYSCGPVLVNIPEGPASMTFKVARSDGGTICGASSVNTLFVSLTIVPVDCT